MKSIFWVQWWSPFWIVS